jgi:hypothetical protein
VKRYVILRKPVKSGDRLIGWIVRLSDGTSYFEQCKRVPRGHCVNYGRQWTT